VKAGGNTALRDALWEALDTVEGQPHPAIVMATDGRDTASKRSAAEVKERLHTTGIPLYVIALKTRDLDQQGLRQLAEQSHGGYLESADPTGLKDLYRKLSHQLGDSYYEVTVNDPASRDFALQIGIGDTAITVPVRVAS
jgi:Mg-chelatase subunit ChlD